MKTKMVIYFYFFLTKKLIMCEGKDVPAAGPSPQSVNGGQSECQECLLLIL